MQLKYVNRVNNQFGKKYNFTSYTLLHTIKTHFHYRDGIEFFAIIKIIYMACKIKPVQIVNNSHLFCKHVRTIYKHIYMYNQISNADSRS